MNCTQIAVLKVSSQKSLGTFLESEKCRPLKFTVTLEILGNLTNETLKRKLADEEVSSFLVFTDFAKSNSAWAEAIGLLYAASGRT